jgi:glycosyltransferase involved in cell wall biosynthesis
MLIDIVIPVLNEEEILEKNIVKVLSFLEKNNLNSCSIIIADNGSTDKTEAIGLELQKKFTSVKYQKISSVGVGRALKEAWLSSNADVVGYMDGDLATDLNHLLDVYKEFEKPNTKIVNGSRLLKQSKVMNRTLFREITSRTFNFLVKILLGVHFSDGMCGFKFFRTDVAKNSINKGIPTNSWIFSTEILAKAEWSGIKIIEIPVLWVDDINRKSKAKVFSLAIAYITHLLKLRKEKNNWI